MYFKYTVNYQLHEGRTASATIKSDEDLDINNPVIVNYFAYAYNIIELIEKIWGVGSVRGWTISNKIKLLQRT